MPGRVLPLTLLALLLAACVNVAPPRDSLDAVARDYVRTQLAIGVKEDGYIDAYYGPAGLQADGKAIAAAESLPQLATRVEQLRSRIVSLRQTEPRRAAFLDAQLVAAATRLRMLKGEKLPFAEEAHGLFGVRPQLKPLSAYDPILDRIDALVPGDGALLDRVEAFQNRFTIGRKELEDVFKNAIAACRTATLRHITLPPGERFNLAFVHGKSWSGYNYYLGDYQSRIEINTDLPIRISRAIDLGCHEGYPGHHALNVLLEERLVRRRGWVEFSVYPLYSPQSLIAEGSANYGIDLAFPQERKLRYEVAVLYPLAKLPTDEAARYDRLLLALRDLQGARMTIAQMLLDGRIGEEEAVQLTQKYQLFSEARARQSVNFTKQYRSYVINYGLGRDMVAADVESAGLTEKARWKRMEQILSEPTLPSDLKFR